MSDFTTHPASFKDPAGFIFQADGKIYRQVNQYYATDYDELMKSGLYEHLAKKGYLIPHSETSTIKAEPGEWYKTLQPHQVPFISYPYEWCFEQLKDAALLTLSILKHSLDYGMIIKDATPYNIQFHKGKPIFIDTLSFEKYDPSQPWVAYRQFCKTFLFPLYLEFYLKTDVQKIMSAYLDGIPVDITSRLLPLKSGLNLGVWLHVYLQNTIRYNAKGSKDSTGFNKKKLLNMVSHLESIIYGFNIRPTKSDWSTYYNETILGKDYLKEKERIFKEYISDVEASTILDLGANDGYFSRICADNRTNVVAVDSDSRSISNLYSLVKKSGITNILPLVIDLSNPSPALGFGNQERSAFNERIQADLVLALALVHHLVIGKNISLAMIAKYMAGIAPQLIIEFVPREDEKVRQMLKSRKDVFEHYNQQYFEKFFLQYFTIDKKTAIAGTLRTLYLMRRKN